MRGPRIRDPRSLWDVLTVVFAYVLLEYVVLQFTGELLIRQELIVIAVLVLAWAVWATFHVLDRTLS